MPVYKKGIRRIKDLFVDVSVFGENMRLYGGI